MLEALRPDLLAQLTTQTATSKNQQMIIIEQTVINTKVYEVALKDALSRAGM